MLRRLTLATLAGTAFAVRAEAQPVAGVEVRWVAPAACPGADDVRARVRRLLGTDTVEASPDDRLIAEGTVVAIGRRYRLSLTVRPENGPASAARVFDSESCENLAGAAAVTLALLARAGTRTEGAYPPPSLGTPHPRPLPLHPLIPPRRLSTRRPRRPWPPHGPFPCRPTRSYP
jgi:hypothetical protein